MLCQGDVRCFEDLRADLFQPVVLRHRHYVREILFEIVAILRGDVPKEYMAFWGLFTKPGHDGVDQHPNCPDRADTK